jgi:arabinofuranosyltransferase
MRGLYRRYRVETWLIFIGLFVIAALVIVQHAVLNEPGAINFISFLGAPLDDVYIHCRYAQNLLAGRGFAFNPNIPLTGDTSPLWVLLIAFGGLLTHDLLTVAILLSIIFYLILGPGVYRTARDVFHLDERWARIAGLITVIGSRMIWSAASGMEVTLAALLMLLVVEEHERAKMRGAPRLREAMWLGLGYNVRPEFLFLIVLVFLDWAWFFWRMKKISPKIFWVVFVLILLVIPYPIYSYSIGGSFVSHSSIVQGAHVSLLPNVAYLWFALKIYASNNLFAFVLIAIGLVVLHGRDEWRLAVLLVVGLPILQAFVAPQFRHHGRYFFPVFPVAMLIACGAGAQMAKDRSRWTRVLAILLLVGGMIEAGRWMVLESYAARNINDQHLSIAGWVEHNTTILDTLAVDDVGALAYITNRSLIDLTGLMTNEIFKVHNDQDAVWRAARAKGANVFIIYDRLNPLFLEHHKDSLVLVQQFRIREPLVSAADTTMSLYRLRANAIK